MNLLRVPEALLASVGAVSDEVARTMAERVRELAEADFGVSITGIAGPGGGSEQKPVGLVYIGLATKKAVVAEKHLFSGLRADVRLRATQAALNLLRRTLLDTGGGAA
jgi:nicotinamide-nucleotide amidase